MTLKERVITQMKQQQKYIFHVIPSRLMCCKIQVGGGRSVKLQVTRYVAYKRFTSVGIWDVNMIISLSAEWFDISEGRRRGRRMLFPRHLRCQVFECNRKHVATLQGNTFLDVGVDKSCYSYLIH